MDNLRTKVLKGMIWKGLERVLAQFVSMIVSIVLARILVPDDYSVVSIAVIFFSFCNLFISSGLNSALIQKKDADVIDYSTIFTTNMVCAAVFYCIMFFLAPSIAVLYKKPIVAPVIRVMGLTFFVNGYKAVLSAKLSSDMLFKKFFFATLTGTVISAIVGITMAYNEFGAWALVAQQMTNSIIDSILLSFSTKIHFKFYFSYERFKSLWKYGGKIFFASILSTIYDECKPLIVGLKFNVSDLAYYNKGMSFPGLINSIGNNTVASTLFPAMSKVQDNRNEVLSMTRRFMRLSSFIVFPMMAGLIAVADNFVKTILTDKWIPTVPYLIVFSISYAFDLVQVGNLQAIKALGRSDYILKMEIIKKSLYLVVIVIFVVFSKSPVVLSVSAIVCTIIATIVNTYPNRKLIGYKYSYQICDLIPNLVSSVIMGVVVFVAGLFPVNYTIKLLYQVFLGMTVYIVICVVAKNENLFYLYSIINRKRE